MTAWRFGYLALLVLPFLQAAPPVSAWRKQATLNHQLAAEIDSLFTADIKDETRSHVTHARVRQIFAKYGVPSTEMVGKQASEEYVVLLSGQPLDFVEKVLPQLKQAAAAGKVPENSYIYLRAQARQKTIRQKFTGPPEKPALQREIERLIKTDQAARTTGQKTWDLKEMEATDRADGIEAHAIFAKYGLPTFALVGPEAAGDFGTVIQHQPLAFQKQVLPQMKDDAEAGQVSSESYAMLLDRVESSSGQPQTYGENFVCAPNGKGKPARIANPKHVDRRRAELGLMSLNLYAKVLGELYMNNLCAQIAAANRKATHGKPTTPHL
ncbi:MAG TPA: DUF6624 domain-containing protein [Candidatus Acidoferrales bacterium]|nr:DUF6624 domain-containing protein [Candidatus Acidoferrales bacterium]